MSTAAPTVAGFDPRSPEYLRDPQAATQELRRRAPVFYYEPFDAYCVLAYDEARRILLDDQTYSSHAYKAMPVREDLRDRIPHEHERVGQVIQGGQLINMDAPGHTPQRRAMQKTFTHKRVSLHRPDIAALAEELIDGLVDRGECDLMEEFAAQLTLRVITTMLDVPQALVPGLRAWIHDVFGILAPIDLRAEDVATPDDQLVANYERLHAAYLTYSRFLEDRRANPGDDLASALLTVTDEDGAPAFSTDQVLGHMIGLTAAGADSTANLIVNMVRLLTEHPDQLALVLGEPMLWDNAVAEGFRRASGTLQFSRISTRESEIAGALIPAGSTVTLCIAAANGDAAMFEDPLRFDVRRPNAGEHLALGRGRHYCLGAPLAMPEIRIALETLYRRLPNLRADLDQPLEFIPSVSVRGIVSQRVTWGA